MKFIVFVAAGLLAGRAAGQDSTPEGPTQTGTIATCKEWYLVQSGDTCATVESKFGITQAQFLAWNPAVSSDCSTNFWGGYSYCVGVSSAAASSATSTRPLSSTSSSASVPTVTSPPGPTMSGTASNCNNWYLVQSGDTCATVESKFGITQAQFLAWNPAVSSDCSTNFWVGEAYCVGVGAAVSMTTSSTSSSISSTRSGVTSLSGSASITTNASTTPYSTRYPVTSWNITSPTAGTTWPPTQTQAGQPSYCNYWHLVQPGDTCNSIVMSYTTWMTLADFFAWNPVVGTDCTGLYVMYWVCVGIQPQTSLTLEYPTATPIVPVAVPWTSTPLPSVDYKFTPSPTQGPLPTNCANYYYSRENDTCSSVISELGYITEQQFFDYNSYLDGDCNGLWAGVYYCVSEWDGTQSNLPQPPTVTIKPASAPSDTVSTCNAWYQTDDDDDCTLVSDMFGTFSVDDFVAWNPSVGAGCAYILQDTFYCVSVPGTPTTRTAYVTPTPTPTAPVQSGIASDCISWWLVKESDTCDIITAANSITLKQFLAWNPSVSNGTNDCVQLLAHYDVCVLLAGMEPGGNATITTSRASTVFSASGTTATASTAVSSATQTSKAPTSTKSGSLAATPSPVQNGMVAGCTRFYLVESGDGCWAIANSAQIALDDFYTWNPAVKSDCSLLLAGYYVCIGLDSAATTITSGSAIPAPT